MAALNRKMADGAAVTLQDRPRCELERWLDTYGEGATGAAYGRMNLRNVYANGQQVAGLDEAGKIDVLSRLTGFSNTDAGKTQIVAQAGDTLRSLSQRVYGNGNLWYLLAEANGLGDDPNGGLVAGTSLTVPEAKTSSNDANTFKPYSPSEITGPVEPALPYIPPPSEAGCNGIAIALMVVAMVVAAIVAPYALALVGQMGLTGALATGVATGLTVAAGSAVSQGIGSALGVASFSWRQVAVDGIVAGITAGAGQALAGTSTFGTLKDGVRVLNTAGRVLNGVVSYGGSVVANAAVGYDTNFSWNSVAATAVGAYLSTKVPSVSLMNQGSPWAGIVNGTANGIVGGGIAATSRRLVGGGEQDWRQIAWDAFGNALGNAAVGETQSWQDSRRIGPVELQEIEVPAAELVIDDIVIEIASPSPALTLDSVVGNQSAASIPSRSGRPTTYTKPDFSNVVSSVSSTETINITTLETVTVVGARPRDLDLTDLASVLRSVASGPRQGVATGVRLFDRDALDYAQGSYGGRVRSGAQFEAREVFRERLKQADANSGGNAQLVMLAPEGMSDYDKLVNAIRAGGGYISEEVGQNLLDQVNSGADAIDLTYVRSQSETALNALRKGSDFLSLSDALRYNSTDMGMLGVETHNARSLAEYRELDRLLPPNLTIKELGVQREVDRAFALASTLGGVPDLAAIPLLLTRGVLSRTSATVEVRKFSHYIFAPGADHGKDVVFTSLGYAAGDSVTLARMYQQQASRAFAKGEYTLGRLDQYGQRVNIEIALPGRGAASGNTSYVRSGWMIQPDGSIKLNTPFSGFTRPSK